MATIRLKDIISRNLVKNVINCKKTLFNLRAYIWWRLMPGTKIKVRWPALDLSPDPNDSYRNWLEENVGRQHIDWDWSLEDDDLQRNLLTVKFRYDKARYATIAALRWSNG